jgi:hypothetical protein
MVVEVLHVRMEIVKVLRQSGNLVGFDSMTRDAEPAAHAHSLW